MRIRIEFPELIRFKTTLDVRITDINYGGHVGNDSVLGIVHEARMRFLSQWGYSEMNAGGCGLIMADSAIQYKSEAFYGDTLFIDLAVDGITPTSFDLYYSISTEREGQSKVVALAKTGMICFDYTKRKIQAMSDNLLHALTAP